MGLKTNKKVIIFVKNSCKTCHLFTDWLDKIHLKYEEREIIEHKTLWERSKKFGAMDGEPFKTIPTIMIKDGKNTVYFNMPRDFKTFEEGRILISNELTKGIGGKEE